MTPQELVRLTNGVVDDIYAMALAKAPKVAAVTLVAELVADALALAATHDTRASNQPECIGLPLT